jgi:CRISPR-associated protein Cas2
MNVHPQVYIVCYDICAPDRLRKVFKIMRSWGDHLQYSVFRCSLSPRQLAALKGELLETLHHLEDQVMFVPIGAPDSPAEKRIFTLGQPLLHPERVAKIF